MRVHTTPGRSLATKRTEAQGGQAPECGRAISCRTCAATVEFSGSEISKECAYCGSPVQDEDVQTTEHRVPVDGVLPFQVDRTRAREALRSWVASRWFAPNEFKKRGVQGNFNGMYFPCWTYDSMAFAQFRGARGDHHYVTNSKGERERRTQWTPVSGTFQRFFDDILVCATRDERRKLLAKLEPWPLQSVKPFNAESLAGYLAMTYELELEDGFEQAREIMEEQLRSEARRRIGGDDQRLDRIVSRHDAVTYKHLLLPVWLLAYSFQKKSYQLVVNACTGEVQGQRPWSIVKIALTTVAVLLVATGLYFATR